MKCGVIFTDDFANDLAAQTTFLVKTEREEWAARLMDEIEVITGRLAAHPELGVLELPTHGVRRLVLPSLPFVVRYQWSPRTKRIVVLRLFHARQRR